MHKAGLAMKAALANNPLYFLPGDTRPTCSRCIGEKRSKGTKKVALYQAFNNSNHQWDTCKQCGWKAGKNV